MVFLKASKIVCQRFPSVLFGPLSFQIKSGDLILLRGENGSGKTTLLKCLAGVLLPTSGHIETSVKSVYAGHEPALLPYLTLEENISVLGALSRSRDMDLPLVELGLANYRNTRLAMLSAGSQQKAGLLKLFMTNASLWFLDEPLSHLDQSARYFIIEVMRDFVRNRGGAIVATTHTDDLKPLATRSIVLSPHVMAA